MAQVFSDLNIQVSRSPEVSVFNKFKKNFESIAEPHTDKKAFDSRPHSNETKALVQDWGNEALHQAAASTHQHRDNCDEFSELCLLYLEGCNGEFTFKQPGALHKARWMSKRLYSAKIVLLEQ